MPFAAAISSATRNARKFHGYGGSEEETRPLNPNPNDYEDVENPFQMDSVASKLDKGFGQECVSRAIVALIFFMVALLWWLIWTTLQWSGVELPGYPDKSFPGFW